MSRFLFLGCFLLTAGLAESVAGQTSFVFSPPHLAVTEGRGNAPYVGAYPNMRWQTVDDDQRGKAMLIKELAVRLDGRSYNTIDGMGRAFTKVSIHMSDGDYATFGSDFSANLKSPPTLVFSKAVRWPTITGFPLLRPARWGGLTDDYRLPFSTQWSVTGKASIISDFTFQGGTLSNQAAWSDTIFRGYYFDSYGPPITSVDGTYRSIPAIRLHNNSAGVTGRCNDSAFGTIANGAYGHIYATLYGPNHSKVVWRNKLVMYSTSHYTAFNAPVIHAWGLRFDPVGFDFMTGCNRLHALGPYFSFTYQTAPRSVDPAGYSGFNYSVMPWLSGLSRLRVTMQAGWADSVTNNLNLTQAREVTLPMGIPSGNIPKRAMLLQHGASVVGPSDHYSYNPGMRYGY